MQKNILITGASRGLGLGLVTAYLEKGARVFACARKQNSSYYAELKTRFGDNLQLVEMDVSCSASVNQAAASIREMTGSLDILINNAGIHAEDSFLPIEEVNVDNCIEVYNVNTLGPLRVTKELLPLLEKGNIKVLANISSEAGSITNCRREKEFDYCMSKAALNMQSVILQNYLKAKGIKVLSIHPGWFRSDMGGPNAHLAVSEAAEGVMNAIENFGGSLDNPVYLDSTGKMIAY